MRRHYLRKLGKSPWEYNDPGFAIKMQQDGPNTHTKNNDDLFKLQLKAQQLQDKFKVCTQPPNSPDTNALDLGFFRALQAKTFKKTAEDQEELINNVMNCFNEYDYKLLNRTWLTLMQAMNCVIECQGNNTCKLPHMGEGKLERAGALPVALEVTEDAKEFIDALPGNGEGNWIL